MDAMADAGTMGGEMAGITLTAISLMVPTILSTLFYVFIKTAPGGIQPGNNERYRSTRKAGTNHVNEEHAAVPAEVVEVAEVPEEEATEEIVPEVVEQVVEEIAEEVEVPVVVEKKKKKKNKTVEPEQPPQEIVEVVEEVPEPVVEEPEPVVQPVVEKKKKKKNKVAASPPPEIVEEAVVPDDTAEQEEVHEEPVQEEEVEPEAVITEDAVVEEVVEDVADTAEETSPEKGKKKKKKKPKASALFAEQFRRGEEPAPALDDFDPTPFTEVDDGEWVSITKKERKDTKASAEEEVAEVAATVDELVEDAPEEEEEVAEDDVAADEEQAPETEEVQEEVVDEDNKEEDEDDANEECDEEADEEANVEDTEQAVEDEEEEEDDEDAEDEEAEKDEEGVDTIDVPYKDRRNVQMHFKTIENRTGVQPIKEVGGTCTIKGKTSAIQEAKGAIQSLIDKGYTILSFENPKELVFDVQGSKIPALIGTKGCIVNKIKDTYHVEIKLPTVDAQSKNRKHRVYVAGEEEGAEDALTVMKDIVEFGFSPLTHPGYGREEVALDKIEKGFVIGKQGSEINKISETYKVRVNLLEDKATILGLDDGVQDAVRHIKSLLEREDIAKKIEGLRKKEQKAAEEAAAKAAAEEAALKAEEENAELEAVVDSSDPVKAENVEDADEEEEEAADEGDDAPKEEAEEEEDDDEEEKEDDEEEDE